jgi:hypothetical protein
MHYNRLIFLVAVINLVVLYYGATNARWWTSSGIELSVLSNLVIVNISAAILIRQHYVINLLFKLATSVPTSWPLAIRWLMGKVYHFGAFHVGGAVVGTIWYAIFVSSLTYHLANGLPGVSVPTVVVTYTLLAFLVLLVVMAMPAIRARYHDYFERTHR